MPPYAAEEGKVQAEENSFVDDEDQEIFRVKSDIVDTAEKAKKQPIKPFQNKLVPKGKGRPILKSSQSAATAMKIAGKQEPTSTIVRMKETIGNEDDGNDTDDIDVEVPELSKMKEAASMPFNAVPRKRGRPAKNTGDKLKVPSTKRQRGRPPTNMSAGTEIKAPKRVSRAMLFSREVDTKRPSRAAAESAKSSITIQSTKKQLYRTDDASIKSSALSRVKDEKGLATPAVRSRGRPPKKQSKQSIFAVEQLVDFKVENGVKLYHVKWINFGASENTWEPLENLEGCKDLVTAFDKKHSESKAKPKKN